ncbi:hypothetical protein H5J25_12375 [Sphingomonas aliaeris]|uniref:Short chain dehydrogenase-like proteobacteria domain-containing protein n=1 Tax=Sphingomonas aliaeris TaxID=2759526 RepID=A0A974S384_9SPHN|nr:hypothetical protein [Sphingomonas aliaeris]QQV76287.1 hypothetical protein H5J25_12375 [Sphingomonas aliaeris]
MTLADLMAEAFARDEGVAIVYMTDGPASAIDRVREGTKAFTLVVVDSTSASVDRAMMLAAIGALAIELGPERRIGALDVGIDGAPADSVSAARFLAGAGSTTGQILALTANGQAGGLPRSQEPSESSTKR